MANIPRKIYLSEDQMPKTWYNIKANMKQQHDPMLHPGTRKPLTFDEMTPVFVEELCRQELDTTNRYIEIPEPVQEYYKSFRPSPLIRAYNLEKDLDTPAHIYYKFEGNNTSGSHKLNSAAAQAFYAKQQGLTYLTTETGAGQWGTALSMSCAFFGLTLKVFMVKVSAQQKPYRRAVMETYGAQVIASPSDETQVGRDILAKFPDTGGSLGCAISEAIETASANPQCRYVLGSVMDHVALHQSVIGLETKTAFEMIGEYPDIIIACAGGGSNMAGLMAPFMQDKLLGTRNPAFIAVEPASCPSLTRGTYAYDFGDTGHMTPLVKMYTLGSEFMPSANHAGGLRYHGMSPILSKLYHDGYIQAHAVEQTKVFDAAIRFARCETILPAPESAHAIREAIDQALVCKETGEKKVIVFGLSGTGYFDMTAYSSYLEQNMNDTVPTDQDIRAALPNL